MRPARAAADVSVVIPVYNRGTLVLEAIGSVLSQIPRPREVIVVDDGSTDDTARTVEASGFEVQLIRAKHRGRAEARNHGITAASSRQIAFLDSDDRWLPGKLARQLEVLESCGTHAIATGYVRIIRSNGEVDRTHTRQLRKLTNRSVRRSFDLPALLFHPAIYPSSLLMNAEILADVGGFDAGMEPLEDWDLMLRVREQYEFRAVPWPPIIEYRVHEENTSATDIARATVAVCGRLEQDGIESLPRLTRAAVHLTRGRALRSLREQRLARREIAKSLMKSPSWSLGHGALRLLAGGFIREWSETLHR